MQASAVDGFSSSILKRSCLDLAALHQLSPWTGSLHLIYLVFTFSMPFGSPFSCLTVSKLHRTKYLVPLRQKRGSHTRRTQKKTKKQVDHDHPSKIPPKMTRPRSKPRSLQGGELSLVDSRERAIINSNSTAYAPT